MYCEHCGNGIEESAKFCTKCGQDVQSPQVKKRGRFFAKKKYIFATIAILVLLIFFSFFYFSKPTTNQTNQDIAAAVVNIYCEGDSEEDASGGSGTIFSEDGLVLTNAHIIPANYREDEINCLVILPDPTTGSPKEIYNAYPIIIPHLSEEYDLAFMQIHDVFYDYEEGKAYGEYPKKFPVYTDGKKCTESSVELGEPVRVYGYPAISGGYALTITDGVVSSLLLEEGLIITSAKISYGNSGGLAVDQNGCMIGVPSMVTGDENESLGIIISTDLISEFAEQVDALSGE